MKRAYIYTTGNHYDGTYSWYVDYHKTESDAEKACKPGWSVCLYCAYVWPY